MKAYLCNQGSHKIANSFMQGLKHFAETKMSVELEVRNSIHPGKDGWNIIATQKPMETYGRIGVREGMYDITFSTCNLDETKAFLLGYGLIASFLSHRCSHEDCLHNIQKLEALEAKYSLSQVLPLCKYHTSWSF